VVQVVGCRSRTVEAQVLFQTSPCEICGGQSGKGMDLSPSTSGFPYLYHSFYIYVALTRLINWRLLGICSFGNRGVVCRKVLSMFSPLKAFAHAVCELSCSEFSLVVLSCLAGKGKPDAAILHAR